MTSTRSSTGRPTSRPAGAAATRPGPATAHLVVSGLLVLSVLVQAAIAGQAQFAGADIKIHGYLGNFSFLLGLVGVALALLARLPGWLAGLTGMVALLMFAQTGLGYVGRDTLDAAAWHIPLGVLIFGLATCQLGGAVVVRRDARVPSAA